MVIPTDQEKKSDIATLKKELNLPEGWKIEYEVRPYLDCDMGYYVNKDTKILSVWCYSVAYPHSFGRYYKALCVEVRGHLKRWKVI